MRTLAYALLIPLFLIAAVPLFVTGVAMCAVVSVVVRVRYPQIEDEDA